MAAISTHDGDGVVLHTGGSHAHIFKARQITTDPFRQVALEWRKKKTTSDYVHFDDTNILLRPTAF